MLLSTLIKEGTGTISELYPEREAREMVFAYLESAIGTRRHTHIVEPGYQVSDEAAGRAVEAFRRMASGEPLQYVTGKAWFYGREFNVTPDVLIPRPETEILCRTVLDSADGVGLPDPRLPVGRHPLAGGGMSCNPTPSAEYGLRVLDMCTGSGCIAWTLALEMPGAQVAAVDISEKALAVAAGQDFSEEISRTGAEAPIFMKADVLSSPPESGEGYFARQFDIIVSNPPYVMDSEKAQMRSNVLEHEPHLALFVPDDDPLVFYRAVAVWAGKLLKPEGLGVVEINEALGADTADVFSRAGFADVCIVKDLNEKDRFVTFRNVPR